MISVGSVNFPFLESGYHESSQGCNAYGRVLAAPDRNVEESQEAAFAKTGH
jgi:hypothetical protein